MKRRLVLGFLIAIPLTLIGIRFWEGLPSGADWPELPFRTEEVVIPVDDTTLSGTLVLPNGPPPYPGAVVLHGSGRRTRGDLAWWARALAARGLAVVVYDKRGVGKSGGRFVPFDVSGCETLFRRLASDARAAARWLAARKDMDASRIGLAGGSQAGWIIPMAAVDEPAISWAVVLAGPAVTCGEERHYSRLTGDDGWVSLFHERSDETIERKMAAFDGPHGFDPSPILARLRTPVLWLLAGRDQSVPSQMSLVRLREAIDTGAQIAVRNYPEADHNLKTPSGDRIDFFEDISEWLRARGVLYPDPIAEPADSQEGQVASEGIEDRGGS